MYITKLTLVPMNDRHMPGDPFELNGQVGTIVSVVNDKKANKTVLKIQLKGNSPWGAKIDK